MAEYGDGWFYGYAPRLDDEGKTVDSRNVIGRFVDHDRLDGAASREQRKSVYVKVPLLESKALSNSSGFPSGEVSSRIMRFDEAHEDESLSEIERFREAWDAYQKTRKAPITEDERQALRFIAPSPSPKVKKPKAVKPAANVVTLPQAQSA